MYVLMLDTFINAHWSKKISCIYIGFSYMDKNSNWKKKKFPEGLEEKQYGSHKIMAPSFIATSI